jgi:hypothetical protein
MALTEQQIIELKEEIEEAKTTVATLTGQVTAITNQLKKEYGVSTLEAAKLKVKEIQKKKDSLDTKIEKLSDELETLLNEIEE